MRIDDKLYFAPGIEFGEIDIDGPRLPDQLKCRLNGFYIEPAEKCAQCGYTFAAGLLLVSCIDALAYMRFGGGVRERFERFACEQLQSFSSSDLAKHFYDDFRNGLVHESRVKNCGQFSLDVRATAIRSDHSLIVNPEYLAKEVASALDSYVDLLERDDGERRRLENTLRADFSEEFSMDAG